MSIPSDRANPQVAGVDRLAGRLVGGILDDGLRLAARTRHTHKLHSSPAGEGPQRRGRAGYDLAAHIAAATPAGPAGFTARLRAINSGVGS